MICPHCEKDIDYVLNISKYYQRQILDSDGTLLDEWEDLNDAIGDSMYNCCPECFTELNFDNNGKLIENTEEDEDSFDRDWCDFCVMSVNADEMGNCPHCGTKTE